MQNHDECDEQHTIIRPIKDGVVFNGRIRFENLSAVELGASCLPWNCQRIAVTSWVWETPRSWFCKIIPKLFLSDRNARYELFTEWEQPIPESTSEDRNITHFKKGLQNISSKGLVKIWEPTLQQVMGSGQDEGIKGHA